MDSAPEEHGPGIMGPGRLEAFSDGVIAVIITIMVLELKAPHPLTWPGLVGLAPVMLSYVLSFLVVAVMWVNHHHIVRTLRRVDGRILWMNLHLLFWMSLIPFTTSLVGENHGSSLATCLYGLNLAACSLAFPALTWEAWRQSKAGQASSRPPKWRGDIAVVLVYLSAAALSFVSVYISYVIYAAVPLLYFVPERQFKAARTA